MSRRDLLSKLRRARRDIAQVEAEVAKKEGNDAAMAEQQRKEIGMARARLKALEFRVDAIEGGT